MPAFAPELAAEGRQEPLRLADLGKLRGLGEADEGALQERHGRAIAASVAGEAGEVEGARRCELFAPSQCAAYLGMGGAVEGTASTTQIEYEEPQVSTPRGGPSMPRDIVDERFDTLERVTLSHSIETELGTMPRGSSGTIVYAYDNGFAYEVEFESPFHVIATVESGGFVRADTLG